MRGAVSNDRPYQTRAALRRGAGRQRPALRALRKAILLVNRHFQYNIAREQDRIRLLSTHVRNYGDVFS